MKLYSTLLLLFLAVASASAQSNRVWTSSEGKTITGSLVSIGDGTVKIRREDGRQFDLPLDRLSAADQEWVKEKASSQPVEEKDRSGGFKEGPFADKITGEWVKVPKEDYGLLFQIYGGSKLRREKDLIPLFIHLHGAGARGDDVELGKVEIAPQLLVKEDQYKETPCVVIVPTCPPDTGWGDHVAELEKIIDTVTASLPIDRNRIYLSGYSMGARGISSMLLSRPNAYAAALFADGEATDKWVESVDAALWLCYSGERDAAKAEAVAKAYETAGKKVRFESHPDKTHNQIHWTLAKNEEFFEWTFEQVRE